ncbi:host-nuclease inhibitor Gam family protein [Bacillus haynesii]|uniref:host-nuclease inhibitor Gam family protein n=1 Tax=Bacillus haynesii TaxID=1925021 RepID=UPI00227F33FD|nr:host-nuclease inhibitor Gam family protein [Bacillus haynesii]MCY7999352.1 host-nuclease inhibitor Gam family protein [Bacillus haynesii]MCY8045743.1 host-nuclease inhibitor Gam family protein [Bacillus haynesii]MCY8080517.1 host-nuclease inhibitor Gam family protein [Bacillus haynesii]MCY8293215.1 host-nuclease inhibitor Gam family protein [Bacillus haynesii]MCY8590278.1 host-nuclease inhibitor Gam family protein [Bacillus haynesii]
MNPLQAFELNEISNSSLQQESRPQFEITDMNSLNWAFRKIAALKTQEKEIKALAATERQRIDEWETQELKPVADNLDFFENLVSVYHSKQLEQDPKAKTLSTPYGKSKSRAIKEQPKPADKDQLLKHVKEAELTEFIKEDVKWGDFKKSLSIKEVDGKKVVVDENGQAVPGVEIEPASTSFKVEV